MKSGVKPKPTVLRVLEGNREHRPIPEGPEPPRDAELPEPPAHLHAYAVEEWGRVAPGLYSIGLLTTVDRAALAGYCQAFARWRLAEEKLAEIAAADAVSKTRRKKSSAIRGTAGMLTLTKNGNVMQNPLLQTANAALRDMLRFAAEFGMTPSARARIDSKRGEDQDEIGNRYGLN